MADLYRLARTDRANLLQLTELAGIRSIADELAWITSHNFRKTNAAVLKEYGLSALAVADQLGHANPSMTQDVYFGRGRRNPAAARALENLFEDQQQTPEDPTP